MYFKLLYFMVLDLKNKAEQKKSGLIPKFSYVQFKNTQLKQMIDSI